MTADEMFVARDSGRRFDELVADLLNLSDQQVWSAMVQVIFDILEVVQKNN